MVQYLSGFYRWSSALIIIVTAFFAMTAATVGTANAQSVSTLDTRATAAWIYDVKTGTVLFEKQADVALPPASMSKLMTLNMLFEALRDGRVTMDTRFSVSARAAAMGGSTMFLNERDRPTVEDLIQGVIVMSGNDACVAIAEGLGGTEDGFARMMNERAKIVGMANSMFANASGWPNPGQRMSMRDLGTLATRLITEFPEYYGYFGQNEFAFDGRAPDNRFNRNPLLKLNIGADGLKTGHTSEAGYGIVGSAVQGTRRIVFVITGMQSERERAEEAESVVNWAFRQFREQTLLQEGQEVSRADVWLGAERSVGLIAAADTSVLIPAVQSADMVETEVVYKGPLQAPITQGDQVAKLIVRRNGLPDAIIPLVAERDIPQGGVLVRLQAAASVLMARWLAPELAAD